jgi:hypothetical protein
MEVEKRAHAKPRTESARFARHWDSGLNSGIRPEFEWSVSVTFGAHFFGRSSPALVEDTSKNRKTTAARQTRAVAGFVVIAADTGGRSKRVNLGIRKLKRSRFAYHLEFHSLDLEIYSFQLPTDAERVFPFHGQVEYAREIEGILHALSRGEFQHDR